MNTKNHVGLQDRYEGRSTLLHELLIALAALALAVAPALGQAPATATATAEVALVEGPLPVRPVLLGVPLVPLDSAAAEGGAIGSTWSRIVTSVEQAGFTFGVATHVDASRAVRGDVTGRGALRSLQVASLEVDLHALLGVPGATAYAEGQSWLGHNHSDDVGDVHGYSNIDAAEFRDVAELWYEQRLFGDALRVKGGYVDANREFMYVENGGGFINSAMGFSPTAFVLPTYPEATLGAIGFVYPGAGSYAGLGVWDGSATATAESGGRELLVLGEAGRSWSLGDRPGRVGAGGWYHSGSFARLDRDAVAESARGWWVVADQTLWSAGESGEQVAGYFQLGLADGRVSELTRHLGAGLAWTGAASLRSEDVLGVGVSRVELSRERSLGYDAHSETVTELYYELHLPYGVVLRPDVQYLHNLGGVRSSRDLVVATLRASFER